MSITSPGMGTSGTPVTPFGVANLGTVPNITPLTVRDGLTYLMELEDVREFLDKVILPFLREVESTGGPGINAALANQAKIVLQAVTDKLSTLGTELVDAVNDPTSELRKALDALYVAK